jgi:hypothetical protein
LEGRGRRLPGTALVEVKIEKGTQQPNQKAFEQIAINHGYYYAIVRSIEDCESLIRRFRLDEI